MKPLKQLVVAAGTASLLLGIAQQGWSDARPNPYLSIVDRNPFGLKDPPPPPDPTPVAPVVPPAKVLLTGITSLFGPSSKRALIEITDQEPGKPANVRKPILREGERDGSIEVVSIDLEKNMVHIRNSGQELDLKFEDASKNVSTAAHPVSIPPPLTPPPTAAMSPLSGSPTIISPASAENSARNSSVSTYGAQPSAPAASYAANAGYGGNGAMGGNGALQTGLGMASGYSRDLRTEQNQKGSDPVVQYLQMAAQAEHGRQNKIL